MPPNVAVLLVSIESQGKDFYRLDAIALAENEIVLHSQVDLGWAGQFEGGLADVRQAQDFARTPPSVALLRMKVAHCAGAAFTLARRTILEGVEVPCEG